MPEYDGYGRLWMTMRNNRLEREREEVGRHGGRYGAFNFFLL